MKTIRFWFPIFNKGKEKGEFKKNVHENIIFRLHFIDKPSNESISNVFEISTLLSNLKFTLSLEKKDKKISLWKSIIEKRVLG